MKTELKRKTIFLMVIQICAFVLFAGLLIGILIPFVNACAALPSSVCYFGEDPSFIPNTEVWMGATITYCSPCSDTGYQCYLCWGLHTGEPGSCGVVLSPPNYDKIRCSSTPPSYTTDCAGMVLEVPNPSIFISPNGNPLVTNIAGNPFQYFLLNEVGTYDNILTGGNFTTNDCDLSTTLTLPANVTGETCYITTTGECNSALSLVPQCSFTAEPRSGSVPLQVTFTDTSTNIVNPQLEPTYVEWVVTDSDTFVDYFVKNEEDWTGWFTETGKSYDVEITVGNVFGYCSADSERHITTGAGLTSNVLYLDIIDAITYAHISNVAVGIQNMTSGVWRNSTSPYGAASFDSTGVSHEYPLSIGQTVNVAADAYGYIPNNQTVTIPYSGFNSYIYLYPKSVTPEVGFLFLTVTVTKNEDGTPLNSAVVQVQSGGNYYEHYTGDNGITTFQNITSSTDIGITAFAQAYATQNKFLPVTSNYMNTSFSLVRVGLMPVTTPATPVTTQTTAPVTTYTDPNTGKPLSTSEGQALDAFAQLAAALGSFFRIGIWIITIWLMWILLYEITGGKVIDKIMRRGRGGRSK